MLIESPLGQAWGRGGALTSTMAPLHPVALLELNLISTKESAWPAEEAPEVWVDGTWGWKNLRLKWNLQQVNYGNQEFPLRKNQAPVPRSTCLHQGHLYNSADPMATTPTPSLTSGRPKGGGQGAGSVPISWFPNRSKEAQGRGTSTPGVEQEPASCPFAPRRWDGNTTQYPEQVEESEPGCGIWARANEEEEDGKRTVGSKQPFPAFSKRLAGWMARSYNNRGDHPLTTCQVLGILHPLP